MAENCFITYNGRANSINREAVSMPPSSCVLLNSECGLEMAVLMLLKFVSSVHGFNVVYRSVVKPLCFKLFQTDTFLSDLKPENILLDYTGHIALCDFGMSRHVCL